jgi:hypothetical protein
MKITKRQLRRIIREVATEPEYGEFAKTDEVKAMLQNAGFNPDGSFGSNGYPGPADWKMYSPETMDEAEGWAAAAIEMNDGLMKAEAALDQGEFQNAEDAFYKYVYPVQEKFGEHGAADTEGREVAAWWLEDQKGFRW